MSIGSDTLMRMFGRPRGLLGRLGGVILARVNRRHAAWVVGLLDVRQQDSVLEIGIGPGVAIEMLAARARRVAGIDPSPEMLRQATQRNATRISERRVELRQASADHLPFVDGSFNKVLAINSMQLWPDALAGLLEISRVIRHGGQLALAFTHVFRAITRGRTRAHRGRRIQRLPSHRHGKSVLRACLTRT